MTPNLRILLVTALTACAHPSFAHALCVPSPEICDGMDNDCDGTPDNSPVGVGTSCGVSQPPCTPGVTACIGGQLVCTGGTQPTVELCDGADNDCNGMLDDSPIENGTVCGANQGACQQGMNTCVGGQLVCVGGSQPSAELCDGIDNDCNGTVDNSPVGSGASCGVNQPPCTTGFTACVGGQLVCTGGTQPTAEVCDGVDNDCDASIDETGAAPDGIDGSADPGGSGAIEGSMCTPSGAACSATWTCTLGSLMCVDSSTACPDGGMDDAGMDAAVDDGGWLDASADASDASDATTGTDASSGTMDATMGNDGAPGSTPAPSEGCSCGVAGTKPDLVPFALVSLALLARALRRRTRG